MNEVTKETIQALDFSAPKASPRDMVAQKLTAHKAKHMK